MFEDVPVPVDFCCNDPDTGLYDGRTFGLEVGPNMCFGSRFMDWGPRVRFLRGGSGRIDRISFARKHFPITHYKYAFGNWCWDRVLMPGAAVIELLNWLQPKGWFDLEHAEIRLGNWWDAGHRWRDEDVRLIAKEFE